MLSFFGSILGITRNKAAMPVITTGVKKSPQNFDVSPLLLPESPSELQSAPAPEDKNRLKG